MLNVIADAPMPDPMLAWTKVFVDGGSYAVLIFVLAKGIPYLLTHMAGVIDKFTVALGAMHEKALTAIGEMHAKCEEGHREDRVHFERVVDAHKETVNKLYDGRIAEIQTRLNEDYLRKMDK